MIISCIFRCSLAKIDAYSDTARTEPACNSSQGLTEVYGSWDVMRNDAICNEVIQSKEVTSLGFEPRTYGLKVCCSTS